ncbi:hypothetical protein HNR46_004102 [Haloferula luteola]|uniref:DUF1257 domain-containing protein n=1 Tax=Haloferula luteola TaxID=595692 RepID=A0A840VGX0_9BACT|nr:DUF1257 domain-containing protein [Haloferula luteola]MBB5353838.1 hypothetical protein [Haloferula luteola]
MSHFTSIQTEIRDLEALRDACVELDLELADNTPCRGYAGITREARCTIVLKGPYDIAVDPVPEEPGRFGLTTDWWDGHVAREVGPGYGRLLQSYGVHKTLRTARRRGLRTSCRVEEDGSVLLTLEGGTL